jgi:hypothetical protein
LGYSPSVQGCLSLAICPAAITEPIRRIRLVLVRVYERAVVCAEPRMAGLNRCQRVFVTSPAPRNSSKNRRPGAAKRSNQNPPGNLESQCEINDNKAIIAKNPCDREPPKLIRSARYYACVRPRNCTKKNRIAALSNTRQQYPFNFYTTNRLMGAASECFDQSLGNT